MSPPIPADTNAELDLVNLLAAVKGPAVARDELVARIKAGKGAFPYQIALARFDLAQGKADDSIKLLQQLIASASSTEEALIAKNTLANIYMSQNKIAAAEPLVTEILRTDARNTNALRLRAAIHLDRGQVDDAIADLRSALNDQPRSPELLLALATAYERNGSIELAGKAFFDAMKASGFSPQVGLAYVAFLQRRSMTTQVESVLTDLANRNPNSVPVLSALARVKLAAPGLGRSACDCRRHPASGRQERCCRPDQCRRLQRTGKILRQPGDPAEFLQRPSRRHAADGRPGQCVCPVRPDRPGRNLHSLGRSPTILPMRKRLF